MIKILENEKRIHADQRRPALRRHCLDRGNVLIHLKWPCDVTSNHAYGPVPEQKGPTQTWFTVGTTAYTAVIYENEQIRLKKTMESEVRRMAGGSQKPRVADHHEGVSVVVEPSRVRENLVTSLE